MANALGSLVVSLGLDAAEFTRGLTKSEYDAQKFARNVETVIDGARASLVAVGAAGASAFAFLNQQAETIATFKQVGEVIGDSASAVASLKLANDLSGVSIDTVAAASVKLTAALSKTDEEGQGAAQALKAIGIEFGAFTKLSPVEQIDAVAQALAGYADGSEKTAVATALFGKSGAQLIPLFNDLADGAARQTALTEAQILAADNYTKQTARLRSEVESFAQSTSVQLVPALSDLVALLGEVAAYSKNTEGAATLLGLALDGVRKIIETVVLVGSDVAFVLRGVGTEIGGIAAQAAALLRLDFAGFNAISTAMKEDAARARAELDRFQRSVVSSNIFNPADAGDALSRRLATAGRPRINTSGLRTGGAAGRGAGAEKDKAAEQALRAAERAASERQRARLQEDEGIRQFFLKTEEDELRRKKAISDEGARVFDATRTPLEKLNSEYERLNSLLQAGAIDYDTYARAVGTAADKYNELGEKIKEGIDPAIEQARRLGDAFAGTFDSAFQKGTSLGDLIKKLAFDAINIQFLTPATQKAGNFLGEVVGQLFKGARAGGGTVSNQGAYLVGERGPELFTPTASGSIAPAGSFGGGSTTNFYYTIDARGADAGAEQRLRLAMEQTKRQTLAEVQARANRGGSFAKAMGRA